MNTEETIMEGHMREHGPLYTSGPLVVFDEGGWVVVWCGVVWCGVFCCVVLCCVVSGVWCGGRWCGVVGTHRA